MTPGPRQALRHNGIRANRPRGSGRNENRASFIMSPILALPSAGPLEEWRSGRRKVAKVDQGYLLPFGYFSSLLFPFVDSRRLFRIIGDFLSVNLYPFIG